MGHILFNKFQFLDSVIFLNGTKYTFFFEYIFLIVMSSSFIFKNQAEWWKAFDRVFRGFETAWRQQMNKACHRGQCMRNNN